MQCNIDARGRAARLIAGLIATAIGAAVLVIAIAAPVTRVWALPVGIGLILFGAFGVFEGWKGWCAVRAMGFKTRI